MLVSLVKRFKKGHCCLCLNALQGMVVIKGQNIKAVQTSGRLTSRSSGLRYAQPLNSSVMQNREDQNPKTKPDFAGSRIREDSVLWVVLLSGNFSGWFLKQVKMVVTSFCLFLLGGCISR